MSQGFFPCFSQYRNDICPLDEVYDENANVAKVKKLLSEVVDCRTPAEVHQKIGSHCISPVRPNSKESKKIISLLSTPETILKIDYGNIPFRIYFSLSSTDGLARIFMIDTKHRFYN